MSQRRARNVTEPSFSRAAVFHRSLPCGSVLWSVSGKNASRAQRIDCVQSVAQGQPFGQTRLRIAPAMDDIKTIVDGVANLGLVRYRELLHPMHAGMDMGQSPNEGTDTANSGFTRILEYGQFNPSQNLGESQELGESQDLGGFTEVLQAEWPQHPNTEPPANRTTAKQPIRTIEKPPHKRPASRPASPAIAPGLQNWLAQHLDGSVAGKDDSDDEPDENPTPKKVKPAATVSEEPAAHKIKWQQLEEATQVDLGVPPVAATDGCTCYTITEYDFETSELKWKKTHNFHPEEGSLKRIILPWPWAKPDNKKPPLQLLLSKGLSELFWSSPEQSNLEHSLILKVSDEHTFVLWDLNRKIFDDESDVDCGLSDFFWPFNTSFGQHKSFTIRYGEQYGETQRWIEVDMYGYEDDALYD